MAPACARMSAAVSSPEKSLSRIEADIRLGASTCPPAAARFWVCGAKMARVRSPSIARSTPVVRVTAASDA